MRSQLKIFGQWKNKLTPSRSVNLAKEMKAFLNEQPTPFEVSFCPSMVALQAVAAEVSGSIPITAQNVIWDDKVSFTGETSAESLVEIGCRYVMIGHSERRLYLGETDEIVAKKALTVVRHGLIPMICIGEFFEDHQQGRTHEVLRTQIATLIPSLKDCNDPSQFIIAYEPSWAITTSPQAMPPSPSLAEERHKYIRQMIEDRWGVDFADKVTIIYGAGVLPDNVGEFLRQPNIDGALAGGTSQDTERFISLIEAARQGILGVK